MMQKALYTKYFVLAADLEKQTKYFQHKMMENAVFLKKYRCSSRLRVTVPS